ncbi:MAG: hypothetical protein KDH20_05500 [Rhodocyclaceae bacterium]|nr:hypothetical protein [Rhodocyclaceae bacterium]
MTEPRKLSLVRLRPDVPAEVAGRYPFHGDFPLVFLGEIPNMAGHGVFVGYSSGRLYSGIHIDHFEELGEDEV